MSLHDKFTGANYEVVSDTIFIFAMMDTTVNHRFLLHYTPKPSFSASVPSCYGDSTFLFADFLTDSSWMFSVTETASGFNQYWSTSGGDSLFLEAGAYTVDFVSGSCISDQQAFTTFTPDSLYLIATVVNETNGGDGAITVDAIGGTSSYSYLWNTGSTNNTISGLVAGIYTLVVSDSMGCTATGTYSIENNVDIFDEATNLFRAFPNPVNEKVVLESSNIGFLSLKITDIYSNLIYVETFPENKVTIPLDNWPSGIYLISAKMKDGSSGTIKLVKL
jgi:hypothetical protein